MIDEAGKSMVWFFEVIDTPRTGGELYNRRLYDYLHAQGAQATAVSVEPAIEAARRRFRPIWVLTPFRRLLVAFLCLWRFKDCRGVLVEPHTYSREMFLLNFWHRFVLRQPVVAILHHYDYYRSDAPRSLSKLLMQLKERLFFLSVDRIVTICQFCRQEIESVGARPQKIIVLRPGFDHSGLEGENNRLAKETLDVLFVGTIYHRNGLDILVEAFARLGRQDVTLHLVGNTAKAGAYLEELRRFIGKAGIEQRVLFHGRVDDGQLRHLYEQADVFVNPTRMTGWGIVFLEAMSFGLPIVATNVGAIPELVEDGANGLLVPPEDPQALAEALERLIADPALRLLMGAEGRRRVADAYSWAEAEQGFHRLVLELGAGGKPAKTFPTVAR